MRAARALLRWSASTWQRQSGVSALYDPASARWSDGQTAIDIRNAAAIRRHLTMLECKLGGRSRWAMRRLTQPLSSYRSKAKPEPLPQTRARRQTSNGLPVPKQGAANQQNSRSDSFKLSHAEVGRALPPRIGATRISDGFFRRLHEGRRTSRTHELAQQQLSNRIGKPKDRPIRGTSR